MNAIQSIHYYRCNDVNIVRSKVPGEFPSHTYRNVGLASRRRLKEAILRASSRQQVRSVHIDIGDGVGCAIWMQWGYKACAL